MVEEGGFEPPKRSATDLQSAPFGHSGTPPYMVLYLYANAGAETGGDASCSGFVELVDGLEPPTC